MIYDRERGERKRAFLSVSNAMWILLDTIQLLLYREFSFLLSFCFVFFLHSKHKMGRLTKNTRRFLLFRTNENKGKFINRSDYFLFYESYLKLATNILRLLFYTQRRTFEEYWSSMVFDSLERRIQRRRYSVVEDFVERFDGKNILTQYTRCYFSKCQ